MRKVKRIFVHCTATPLYASVSNIMAEFERKGWKSPGYHFIIPADGRSMNVHPLNLVANGVQGYNQDSVHVAWIGGIDDKGKAVDNRTMEQKEELREILQKLRKLYPQAEILGHRDISPDLNKNGIVDPWERIKECPCFDAREEYKDI